jgi:4-hydroxy-3-methylbut-2-enyl diphosphate reductase
MIKQIIMAQHHGFCMGTAQSAEGSVTILNEIVHNESVVEKFRGQGVGQAFSVEDVNEGTLIISAHGIAPDVIKRAEERGLRVIDATCPLVTRIYDIIVKAVENGFYIIHYGDPKHDETHGVQGYAPDKITVAGNKDELLALPDWKDRKLGLTVQTTAHEKEFEEAERLALGKWPHIKVFNTICNATTKRQQAILELAPNVDMVLVVGSKTSANSNRLAQISDAICGRGFLIDSVKDVKDEWFVDNVEKVGISAGASTPDFLVEAVIQKLVDISGGRAEVILPEKKNKIARVAR